MKEFLVLGLMSGTSLDGIDLALLQTDGESRIAAGADGFAPYSEAMRRTLRALLTELADCPTDRLRDRAHWPPTLAQADEWVTQAHSDAVQKFLTDTGEKPDLIGFHGQTVCHRPQEKFTLQIGDGAALAAAVGVSVVGKFRLADMVAGGQGAPLAPLYHAALVGEANPPLAVVNLGGITNITWLCGEEVLAFDTGPANALLDDWVFAHTDQAYDKDGGLAAQGKVNQAALDALLVDDFFKKPPPKSLDRLAFDAKIVQDLSAQDGAATLAAFTIETLLLGLAQCPSAPQKLILCGGGRHNKYIVRELAAAFAGEVVLCEALGWQGDRLEAQAFAWLAVRALKKLPLSLPTTTGAKAPTSGGVVYHASSASAAASISAMRRVK